MMLIFGIYALVLCVIFPLLIVALTSASRAKARANFIDSRLFSQDQVIQNLWNHLMSAFARIEYLENQLRMIFEARQVPDQDVSTQHNPNEMLSEQTVDETLRRSELVRPAQQDQIRVNEESVVRSPSFVSEETCYRGNALSTKASYNSPFVNQGSIESVDEPLEGPPSPFENKESHRLGSNAYVPSDISAPAFKEHVVVENAPKEHVVSSARIKAQEDISDESTFAEKFPHLIAEHWVGLLGAIILVAGVGFIGVYGALFVSAFYRFLMLVGGSVLLGTTAFYLHRKEKWQAFAGWIGSASAATFLFACLGASTLQGLKWVDSFESGVGLIAFGIVANLFVAWILASQTHASLHTVLSLFALAFIPPTLHGLIIATIVVLVALSFSYRYRWDLHLIIVLLSYLAFIVFYKLHPDLSTLIIHVGKISIVAVCLVAALIHYRKDYAQKDVPGLAALAHLLNWLFVIVGLVLYATGSRWDSIPIGVASIALFVLAQYAKRIKVEWVYLIDTIMSEFFAIAAILLLSRFQIDYFIIAGILFFETQFFYLISKNESETIRAFGLLLTIISSAALIVFSLMRFDLGANYALQDMLVLFFASVGAYSLFANQKTSLNHFVSMLNGSVAQIFLALSVSMLSRINVSTMSISALVFTSEIAFATMFYFRFKKEDYKTRRSDDYSELLIGITRVFIALASFAVFVALFKHVYVTSSLERAHFIEIFSFISILSIAIGFFFEKNDRFGLMSFSIAYSRNESDKTIRFSIPLFFAGLLPLILTFFFEKSLNLLHWQPLIAALLVALIYFRKRFQSDALGIAVFISTSIILVFALIFFDSNNHVVPNLIKLLPLLAVPIAAMFWSNVESMGRRVVIPSLYQAAFYWALVVIWSFTRDASIVVPIIWALSAGFIFELSRYFACQSESIAKTMAKHLLRISIFFYALFAIAYLFFSLRSGVYYGEIAAHLIVALIGFVVSAYCFMRDYPSDDKLSLSLVILQSAYLEVMFSIALISISESISGSLQPLYWVGLAALSWLVSLNKDARFSRLRFYGLLLTWLALGQSVFHLASYTGTALWFKNTWAIYLMVAFSNLAIIFYLNQSERLKTISFPSWLSVFRDLVEVIVERKHLMLFYPLIISTAIAFYLRFDRIYLTALWVAEIFAVFSLALYLQKNHYRILSLVSLALCLLRLVFFDLVDSPVLTKGFVFVTVGGIMLAMNAMYVRYGPRLSGINKRK